MVYGELGRHPLEIEIQVRMVSFWSKLISNDNKLSSIMYKILHKLHINGTYHFKWVSYIKSIFDKCGISYIWDNQIPVNGKYLKTHVKQLLRDQFFQLWHNDIVNSSRGEFYSIFKTEFGLANYLLKLSPSERIEICRIRTSNLRIPIESGRWYGIQRSDRLCNLCDCEQLGDEYHYLYICKNPNIIRLRHMFIPAYCYRHPNVEKMKGHLYFCNIKVLKNLSRFIRNLKKLF